LQGHQNLPRRCRVDSSKTLEQTRLIHGADLIENDLALFALEGKWNAGRVIRPWWSWAPQSRYRYTGSSRPVR